MSEREMATEPLLDPANVGKWVHYRWNANRRGERLVEIVKVTRTHVHVRTPGRSTAERMMPGKDPGYGFCQTSGYSNSILTDGAMQRQDEELRLRAELRAVNVHQLDAATARRVLAVIVGDVDEWRAIADALHDALASFMGYDGYGQGGADDGNRGDWRAAEAAVQRYQAATS